MKRLCGDITEETVNILFEGQFVGTLTRRMNDACEEEYVFRVDWEAYDRVNPDVGITGLDMDLRKEEYVRDHVPSFIYDVMPPASREDIRDILRYYGLDHYDAWDLLVATKRKSNDGYTVELVKEN